MGKVILTVQNCGNGKYKFGINSKDSREIFKKRLKIIFFIYTKNINQQN